MILRGEEHADLTPAAEIMMATWKVLNAARGLNDTVDLRAMVAALRKARDELANRELVDPFFHHPTPYNFSLADKRLRGSLELAEAALKFIEAWGKAELGGARAHHPGN